MKLVLRPGDKYSRKELVDALSGFETEDVEVLVEEDSVKIAECGAPERKIVAVPKGGIAVAIGRIFKTSGRSSMTETELVHTMSFEKKWCAPGRARDIIFTAEKEGLVKRTGEEISLMFGLDVIPDEDRDYSYLNRDSAIESMNKKSETPEPSKPVPPKKPVLWTVIRKQNDRCKKCRNLNTGKCDDCYKWSNEKA